MAVKRRVVLRRGQVADVAWLARTVLESGAKDGLRLAAIGLLAAVTDDEDDEGLT